MPQSLPRLLVFSLFLLSSPAVVFGQATAQPSLEDAQRVYAQGVETAEKGDYGRGEEILRQALAIQEELAPGSLPLAVTLNKLGVLARRRDDLDTAADCFTRSEEIQARQDPESLEHGKVLMNLGILAMNRGDLERADSLYWRALAIFERTEPGGRIVAGCLHNLVNVAMMRGDLAAADSMLRRILSLHEGKTQDDWEIWRTLNALGNLAVSRNDLDLAQAYFERALPLSEKLAAPGREVAISLGRLGDVARRLGDVAATRSYLQRAQEIEERLAPEGVGVAEGLEDLAHLDLHGGGDLAAAEKLLRRALGILEKDAPESLLAAAGLRGQGEIADRRGRPQEAAGLYRRALALQSRLAPGSAGEAAVLSLLGGAESRAGQAQEGLRDLCRAVDVLDRQRARLGGTPEAKTTFEANLGDTYHACLEGLLAAGRPGRGVSRPGARPRALVPRPPFGTGSPPPRSAAPLAADRRRLHADYDRVVSQLAALNAGRDAATIERLTGELRDLRSRQEEIRTRIRRESPRSAALQDPQPLDLAATRAVLDAGTVLLEYAVGEQSSWLFAVQPAGSGGSGLSVFRLAAGAEKLRQEVESFRLLMRNPGSESGEIQSQARRLYDRLIRPAESRLTGAQRILVSADGPLHTLPFAALRRGSRYLIEWKPVHSVLSATVYAELARSRPPHRAPGEERLVAFGDPDYRALTSRRAPSCGKRSAAAFISSPSP